MSAWYLQRPKSLDGRRHSKGYIEEDTVYALKKVSMLNGQVAVVSYGCDTKGSLFDGRPQNDGAWTLRLVR